MYFVVFAIVGTFGGRPAYLQQVVFRLAEEAVEVRRGTYPLNAHSSAVFRFLSLSFAKQLIGPRDFGTGCCAADPRSERQSKEAAIHRDVEFAARTLADDYIAIGPLGQVSTKADILAARKHAQLRYDAFDTSEVVVRVYGHTAVVTGRAEVKGTDLGEDFSGPYRFTRIWVKRDGRWETVNYQVTVTR